MAKASWKLCSISGLQTPSASAPAKSFSSYIYSSFYIIKNLYMIVNQLKIYICTSLERSSGERGNSPAMFWSTAASRLLPIVMLLLLLLLLLLDGSRLPGIATADDDEPNGCCCCQEEVSFAPLNAHASPFNSSNRIYKFFYFYRKKHCRKMELVSTIAAKMRAESISDDNKSGWWGRII